NMKIKNNLQKVLASGTIKDQDIPYFVDEMRFTIESSGMLKADWITLDLIQQNDFERPVYFASNSVNSNHLGLGAYFRLDGLVYRLVPVNRPPNPQIPINSDPDILYDRMINKISLGEVENPEVLLDEQVIRSCRIFR